MVDRQARAQALKKRIERFETGLTALNRRSSLYSWIRLGIFLVGVSVSLIAYLTIGLQAAIVCAVIATVAFAAAVMAHRRIKDTLQHYKIWTRLKKQHLARIELDWAAIPTPPFLPIGHDHPFGLDLDIVGKRSLTHLLNTAISYEGSLRLQEWLLTPVPDPVASQTRQRLVSELAPMAHFRDKLSLNATISHQKSSQPSAILRWLHQPEQQPAPVMTWMVVLLTGLAISNAVLWLANQGGLLPPLWQVTMVIYWGLYAWNIRRFSHVFEAASTIADELEHLQSVFRYLETYSYKPNTHLKQLLAPFLKTANRPSAKLRQLNRIVSGASIRHHALLWFSLNTLLPWDLYIAFLFQRMKADLTTLVPRWLDVWFELEALASLASFAYLNTEYTFPELLRDGKTLSGKSLGHPLIPFDQKVCNDYRMPENGAVDLVTGSNMSGKSTFLRTLGVNLCLAYAGGPVNTAALTVSPFRIFTCIRVSDSVTDGVSYFYAEVKRLKALLNALQQPADFPLFFLIDEIFRGTNNRERLIGSRAYIQSLVGQDGVGLIATHDLELVALADEIPTIRNYHFEETIVDGQMAFDYQLRPGPSPTTNALKIMQLEGLPIPSD